MKFSINKNVFEDALSAATRFVSPRISGNQAILGCLIKVTKKGIIITTTNLNDFYTTDINTKTEKEGIVVLDIRKLIEFLHYLPPGEVEIEEKEKTVEVRMGKTTGLIQVFKIDEFPQPPEINEEKTTINKTTQKGIKRVVFSASKDEARPVLTGTLMINKNKKSIFVSTDGFRLSYEEEEETKKLSDLIIPAWVLEEAINQAGEEDLVIEKNIKENIIKISTKKATIYSRLLSGDFPPFEKVIPTEHTTKINVKKEDLLKGVRLAAVFAKDQADVIILNISQDGLFIIPKGQPKKGSTVFIETEKISGENLIIAFNYRYILEFLSNSETNEVVLEFTQSTAPGVFMEKGNKKYKHIIMPLRTEETTPD